MIACVIVLIIIVWLAVQYVAAVVIPEAVSGKSEGGDRSAVAVFGEVHIRCGACADLDPHAHCLITCGRYGCGGTCHKAVVHRGRVCECLYGIYDEQGLDRISTEYFVPDLGGTLCGRYARKA